MLGQEWRGPRGLRHFFLLGTESRPPTFDSAPSGERHCRVCNPRRPATNSHVRIERGELHHIVEIAPLFDAYRRFYGRADDPRARSFLEERIARQESAVFIARLQGTAIGFCQLYPCFASVSLTRMFVLYDLFGAPQARRGGAASALLRAAVDYAAAQGAGQLMLQTGTTNLVAQQLYEREGWVRDNDFYVYEFHLPAGEQA
jgi:ribosomal protein S18 acetylase RimI-like enzyme